jgi:hypothetical protein
VCIKVRSHGRFECGGLIPLRLLSLQIKNLQIGRRKGPKVMRAGLVETDLVNDGN